MATRVGVPGRGPQEATGSLLSHPRVSGRKTGSAPGAEGTARKVKVEVKAPASAQRAVTFRQVKLVSLVCRSLGVFIDVPCAVFFGSPRCSIGVSSKENLEVHLMENRIRPGEGGGGFAW